MGKSTIENNFGNIKDFFTRKNILPDSDIKAIEAYNAQLEEGTSAQTAFNRTMLDASDTAQKIVEGANGNAVALGNLTRASKASAMGMQALSAAGNMFVMFIAAKVIESAVNFIDGIVHQVEIANEEMDEALSEYESAKSSLEGINSELADQNRKMNELLAKDHLTYAEKGQLEELQAITKELMVQQDIEERRTEKASKEAAQKTVKAYDKQFGKYDLSKENVDGLIAAEAFPLPMNENDVVGNIAAFTRAGQLLQSAQEDYQRALETGEDTAWYAKNVQFYIDKKDELSEALDTNLSDMQEKRLALEEEYNKAIEKRGNTPDLLTSLDKDIIKTYEEASEGIRLIYEYTNQAGWNDMEISNIFGTEGIEKTKSELMAMAKEGTLTPEMISGYEKLNEAIQNSDIFLEEGQSLAEAFCEEIYALVDASKKMAEEGNGPSFDISAHKDALSDVQSSISTLRSALDSLNTGELDQTQVLDLMQQFPELVPYIDLTAEGFGNLSEGLNALISQQPDALIQELRTLKESLSTEEEREQVNMLIDSLQRLGSCGDTGAQAYAAAIGNTWNDTANVISGVTTQFENLAKVQEAVADGLTLSTGAAAELARIYPEILANAVDAGDGQITLNEAVVGSILEGDQSVIDAQIAKLEADKASLTAKKAFAEGQLNIIKQTAEGEGGITKETAQYRINAANDLLKALVDAGLEEDRAYAAVAANMAGNTDEFNRIAGEAANDIAVNMGNASQSMAESMSNNSKNAQESLNNIQKKAHDLALAIQGAAKGVLAGSLELYEGGGSTKGKGIEIQKNTGSFKESGIEYDPVEVSLDDFQSNLELDIKGYTDAISNIDSQIGVLKELQASFNAGGIGGHGYADKIEQLEKEKGKINESMKEGTDPSGSASSSAQSQFSETLDFFERRVKALDNGLALLKSASDNVSGAFAKNTLTDAQLSVTEEKLKNYKDALSMYSQKAGEAFAKLPADVAAQVKAGAVALTEFTGSENKNVVEAIKEYESWAGKVTDCRQELEELQGTLRKLELEKFNHIMDSFSEQYDLRDNGKDLISKQMDLLKEAGEFTGSAFYTARMDQTRKQLALLEEEKAQLAQQAASALGSGRIRKGTEEWMEMVKALSDVEGNILDCKKSIEELDNSLLNLHTEIFDRIQKQFSDTDAEISRLAGLFEDFDPADEKGDWTGEGLARLGLLAQQYELSQYRIRQYNDEIDELKAGYQEGRYSASEYADKLSDLSSAQWDAVNASQSARDAIMDLNKARVDGAVKGIEKEIDSYKELTDAQLKALEASRDLHRYENTMAEKTKSVTDLERRIAAMQYDTSASAAAKRKQLEEELSEARKALEEAEYDHSMETRNEALNSQRESYEEARREEIEKLRASLNEKEVMLEESFETVKNNAALIGWEIANAAALQGIAISGTIVSSWQSGENAVAAYGETLSQNTSVFIGNLMGVEAEVWNLQARADNTASSLAWMFAARADSLVNELNASYYAESNLAGMTGTLQQALSNTLERGYNVNGILSSLDSVRNAANAAAKAVDSIGTGNRTNLTGGQGVSDASKENNKKAVGGAESPRGIHIKPYDKAAVHAYAGGTRATKGNLIVTDEEGEEMKLPRLKNGQYTIAREGTQILTKHQTDNLFRWSGFSPEELAKLCQPTGLAESVLHAKLPEWTGPSKELWDKLMNHQPVTVHYDSLVTVNGDVNDTNHFTNQVAKIARQEIDKDWQTLNDAVNYRSI